MNEQTLKNTGFFKGIFKATVAGTVVFAILTLLTSVVFYFFSVKEEIIPLAFKIILFLSAFVTGILSSKNASSKGYLRGIASGMIFIFIVFVLFWILKKPTDAKDGITYTIMLLLSFFGGILGINYQ